MARIRAAGEALVEGADATRQLGARSAMRESAREIFYALATGAVGIFFIVQSSYIETSQNDLVGPQLVPMLISSLMAAMALLQLTFLFVGALRGTGEGEDSLSAVEADAGANASGMARMAAVIVLGIAYIWLFSMAGYLVSTALILGALLLVFGNRQPLQVIVLTLGGSFVYYLVFIHFMGIQDSIGWHLDLSSLGLR